MAQETTPLLNGEASDRRANENGSNGHHIHVSRGSGTVHFLFNSKHTPGVNSDNIVVKSLAYTWHITKVTLLSSKCSTILESDSCNG